MKALILALSLTLAASGTTTAWAAYQPCSWEKQIVAACLVLEASDQGELGMRGVASVIRNRAGGRHSNILKVVKRPYAFSALNAATSGKTGRAGFANHVRRASRDRHWQTALRIVEEMYTPNWFDITNGADHYARVDIRPNWTYSMSVTAEIGAHRFYSSFR